MCREQCLPSAGAQLSSTTALHRGPVTAVAALPEAQGALAVTGGQDAAVLLCSVPALTALTDESASAAAQPLVAYRCTYALIPLAAAQTWLILAQSEHGSLCTLTCTCTGVCLHPILKLPGGMFAQAEVPVALPLALGMTLVYTVTEQLSAR